MSTGKYKENKPQMKNHIRIDQGLKRGPKLPGGYMTADLVPWGDWGFGPTRGPRIWIGHFASLDRGLRCLRHRGGV